MTKEKVYAIIDVGSNSVRLMFATKNKTLKKYLKNTKLAEGLAKTGRLSVDAIKRTTDAIFEFVSMAKEQNVEVHIFATEAVRSATNSQEFLNSVFEKTGVKIDVVPGEMEAQLGFVGASNNQNVCIVDIGGASTEIVCGDKGEICYAKSLPIGAVRLLDICGEDIDKLDTYIGEQIKNYQSVPKMQKLVAIGGTASTIVSVLLELEPYDTNKVHNFKLSSKDVLFVHNKIKNTPLEERKNIKGLPEGRKDIIVGASYELFKIMNYLNFEELFVSESDNQEGYLKLNIDKW